MKFRMRKIYREIKEDIGWEDIGAGEGRVYWLKVFPPLAIKAVKVWITVNFGEMCNDSPAMCIKAYQLGGWYVNLYKGMYHNSNIISWPSL